MFCHGYWRLIVFDVVQQGSPLPEIELQEGAPDKNVKLTDIFKGKKGILFGVPGAFTPGCSKVIRDFAIAFDPSTGLVLRLTVTH